MSLSDNDKSIIREVMNQLLNILDRLDELQTIDPHAIDLIEIAGSSLERQLKNDIIYDNNPPHQDNDDNNETSEGEEAIENQANAAISAIESGLIDQIMKDGGFQFLNKDAKDAPSADELKGWFDIGE